MIIQSTFNMLSIHQQYPNRLLIKGVFEQAYVQILIGV
jgi:hypothetical protein